MKLLVLLVLVFAGCATQTTTKSGVEIYELHGNEDPQIIEIRRKAENRAKFLIRNEMK